MLLCWGVCGFRLGWWGLYTLLTSSRLQVFYYLRSLDDALTHALGAGALFDISEQSEYVKTIVGARAALRPLLFQHVQQTLEPTRYDRDTARCDIVPQSTSDALNAAFCRKPPYCNQHPLECNLSLDVLKPCS